MSIETVDSIDPVQRRSRTQQDQSANDGLSQKFANLMQTGSGSATSSLSGSGVVADAAAQAYRTATMNAELAAITQQASVAAAVLKLKNEMNDATVNFTKNIGSSVKSAAQ